MKRFLDIYAAVILLIVSFLPMLLIAFIIKITSKGPVLHWSDRVGAGNRIFKMPKFRTMVVDAPHVATHLLSNPETYLTPIGRFLRKSSLDELPQLWSVLKGDMCLVGPRPALYNQDDLIELRTKKGIHRLTPGLTGWAQINGRDELPIPVKVEFDEYYLKHKSLRLDLEILLKTGLKTIRSEGVSH